MTKVGELQYENSKLRKEVDDLRCTIRDLYDYVQSRKFHCGSSMDGYVNTDDIVNRIVHKL